MTPTELSNLRFALFDVMDEGDLTRHRTDGMTGAPWLIYDLDQKFAQEQRLYFVSAVLTRWRHLNDGEMHKVATTAPGPKEQGVTHSMVFLPDYSPQADEMLICDQCDTVQPGMRDHKCLNCHGSLRVMQPRDFK